jgi:hypothetical protein
MRAHAPIKLSEANRHGTMKNDNFVGSRLPLRYPQVAAGMAFSPAPALPSRSAKELIGDTCYNVPLSPRVWKTRVEKIDILKKYSCGSYGRAKDRGSAKIAIFVSNDFVSGIKQLSP